MDPRHEQRLRIVQNLYAASFLPKNSRNLTPLDDITCKILDNLKMIDDYISENAPRYPLNRIAKIDLSILRLAVYELTITKSVPPKVIINEAVELAKELGSERSYAFINAVLGSILQKLST